jgi:hypothetical protein
VNKLPVETRVQALNMVVEGHRCVLFSGLQYLDQYRDQAPGNP